MKVKKYAISVQYGQGMHYFATYEDDYEEAIEIANRIQANRYKKGKGAKPRTMIWELKDEIITLNIKWQKEQKV